MKDSRTPEQIAWKAMIQRCTNPKSEKWPLYGGRGISVCPEWRHSYKAFLEHIGPRPSAQHSVDRYPNNDGNYEPGNVRWATRSQQRRNTRVTVFIELNGERRPMREWLEIYNLHFETFRTRLKHGWTVGRALTEKPDLRFSQNRKAGTRISFDEWGNG